MCEEILLLNKKLIDLKIALQDNSNSIESNPHLTVLETWFMTKE